MSAQLSAALVKLLSTDEQSLIDAWIAANLQSTSAAQADRAELQVHCNAIFAALRHGLSAGLEIEAAAYDRLRDLLGDLSRNRAMHGYSPSETATLVFSLKQPIFARIRDRHGDDAAAIAADTWAISELIDKLGLFTLEVYQKSREGIIVRQQQELAELSTPVVRLWQGILALPLIGTLDSSRTQVVMENLLQSIVEAEAEIAIIDITGVPTVDTLVAQHLLKTVAAARLMGADCLISGIRPQIAQTMVHLGVELNVVSKASLADAFALALERLGRAVVRRGAPPATNRA